MKLEFGERAENELGWFTEYFTDVFIEGKEKGFEALEETINIILAFPEVGHPLQNSEFREIQISKTKFSIIYEYKKDKNLIWILSIWDSRRNPFFKFTSYEDYFNY